MSTDRDGALLHRAGHGDDAAFALLYDMLSSQVHAVVLRVVRDPARAEEVTQEVFLELWRLAPRYERGRGSVASWVATIAHRRAVDRVRSEQARRDREGRVFRMSLIDESMTAASDSRPDRLQIARVHQALEQLTEKQREAIELAYLEGHTYREVAAVLETSEATVTTRIRDGMIKLRGYLGVMSRRTTTPDGHAA